MKVMKESPQGTNRKNAVIAGVLFIIGTASGALSAAICSPVLSAPVDLLRISANEGLINLGSILQFIMAISCAGIGLALYPVLRRFSEGLAIGAVGFRLVENALQILKAVSMITLLAISQAFIRAGSPTTSYFQSIAQIVTAASDWMTHGAALICFAIGAALYYLLFYQHRLIPRWLSGWGLVSVALTILSSMLELSGVIPAFGIIQIAANLSILVQEMVFAVWLIAKGLDQSIPDRN